MVGNFAEVTAAPARTSAPSGPRVESNAAGDSAPQAAPAGNEVAVSGETLPPAPEVRAVIDVERTLARLNEIMDDKQRKLFFQVDADGGRTVITVVNTATGEIVREIPAEEAEAVAAQLESSGAILDAWV